ncbi:hypothetical protein Bra471DRAFT_02865 [Bradyrhizobium sp. WSM471]|nr:hypothetical protein Bra471DRAFT_02865 [Bradyrhizobium sp. WSM471]
MLGTSPGMTTEDVAAVNYPVFLSPAEIPLIVS